MLAARGADDSAQISTTVPVEVVASVGDPAGSILRPSGPIGHVYDFAATFVAPNSSTVYRVQGGVPPAASQTRAGIGSAGEMTVSGDGMLFVSFDDVGRAQAFAANNRPGASIMAFDVLDRSWMVG